MKKETNKTTEMQNEATPTVKTTKSGKIKSAYATKKGLFSAALIACFCVALILIICLCLWLAKVVNSLSLWMNLLNIYSIMESLFS